MMVMKLKSGETVINGTDVKFIEYFSGKPWINALIRRNRPTGRIILKRNLKKYIKALIKLFSS
jgi:hypothetical protein